jgi:Uma2 family endonuclease
MVPVFLAGTEARIPPWVTDLAAFRRWARSDEFPRRGRYAYLAGDLWVDELMERLFSHNLLKTEFAAVLTRIVKESGRGYYFGDRVFLTNAEADLSTEPDGTFVSFESLRSGRVRTVGAGAGEPTELEGAPDMVLEVVSRTSVRKDLRILRELYGKAGIAEYWVVDARSDNTPPAFTIFRHTAQGYAPQTEPDGRPASTVLAHAFELVVATDAMGNRSFTLHAL